MRDEVTVLDDGSAVQVVDEHSAEIRDPQGRLLLRYRDGVLELGPEAGDLVLRAPEGTVRVQAGSDVCIEAGGELQLGAATASLRSERLEVEVRSGRVVAGAVETFARELVTTATHMAHTVERFELEATRIVETARDAFREVQQLAQHNIGRLHTVVRDVYTLDANRTYLRSKEDTAIDGKRVLLG